MHSEAFWNETYGHGEIELPDANDPVLLEALKFFGDVSGKKILDIGCGGGATSLFFAGKEANVVSIDTSQVAIGNLAAFCGKNGISNITPIHMSAMDISSIGPFDFIIGSMILHHIEPFEHFATILHQAMIGSGKAFFYENSAASSLLVWFREHVVGKLWVPKLGDDDEFPLTLGEVATLRKYFSTRVTQPELLLFGLISCYLLRGKLEKPFAWLDALCYKSPWMRKYSYRQYIYLQRTDKA